MKKIRTFIAHPVPDQWKEILGNAFGELRQGVKSRVAWVKPENMHFTLKFLGSVSEDFIPALHKKLLEIPAVPFEMSAGNSGFFPGPEKPHVIWIGLGDGAKEICTNAAAVDEQLCALDFEKNTKPCHAHLTLGRVKKHAEDDWPDLIRRINAIELPRTTVTCFKLYQSVLTPQGPVYSVLHKYGD